MPKVGLTEAEARKEILRLESEIRAAKTERLLRIDPHYVRQQQGIEILRMQQRLSYCRSVYKINLKEEIEQSAKQDVLVRSVKYADSRLAWYYRQVEQNGNDFRMQLMLRRMMSWANVSSIRKISQVQLQLPEKQIKKVKIEKPLIIHKQGLQIIDSDVKVKDIEVLKRNLEQTKESICTVEE